MYDQIYRIITNLEVFETNIVQQPGIEDIKEELKELRKTLTSVAARLKKIKMYENGYYTTEECAIYLKEIRLMYEGKTE